MGLVHTSGIEFGRYRELARKCTEVNALQGKRCLYLDFDGKSFGLANKLLIGANTTIHSLSQDTLSKCERAFSGRTNVFFHVHPRLEDSIFGSKSYDVLVWWNGPQSDEDYKLLESAKGFFGDLIVVGASQSSMSRSEMKGYEYTEFAGLGLAFLRSPKDAPAAKKTRRKTVKKAPPAEKVEAKQKESAPAPSKTLKGGDVTVGEMKTQQHTQVPTNIKSSSAKVQDMAKPHKEEVKKKVKQQRAKKKQGNVEAFLKKSNDKVKLETAFLLSGSLPESVAEAEDIIKKAPAEELELVI